MDGFRNLMMGALLLAMAGLAALPASPAFAALPAPGWLPGQPMLAGNQIIAMWLPIPGAVKYILYVNGGKLSESPSNQYIGLAPEKAGEYKYEVAAVDASGAEGARSELKTIAIISLEPPASLMVRPDAEERSVGIRWDKPQMATVYNVYKAESEKGPWALLSSIQGEIFKDSNLEYGKYYYYAVSSKDVSGKESAKSPVAAVKIDKPRVVEQIKANKLNIIPTRETAALDFIDGQEMSQFKYFFSSAGSNRLFIQLTYGLMELNPADLSAKFAWLWEGGGAEMLEGIPSVVVKKPKELANPWSFTRIAFLEDDLISATDRGNGRVLVIDLKENAVTKISSPLRMPTKKENEKVYEAILPAWREWTFDPGVAIRLKDGTWWVSDGQADIWAFLDADMKLVGWNAYCYVGDPANPTEVGLPGASTGAVLDNGDVLIYIPSVRYLYRIDPKNLLARYTIGQSPTFTGNFLGWGSWQITKRGEIVTADPTMNHIQVFDLATGAYLYSFGGPEAKADPKQSTRPELSDLPGPYSPILMGDGKRLLVYSLFQKFISVREILAPLPAIPPPPAPEKG